NYLAYRNRLLRIVFFNPLIRSLHLLHRVPLVAACRQPRESSTPPSLVRIFILECPHT
uniref:Myosin motor domain-containing protein n=1 Tax=Mesocestoides corti TaxID=53468 RepID=A0A5K3EGW3_MESCO